MTPNSRAALPEQVGGQVCAMVAVDIARYTARDEEIQLHLRAALYGTLRAAFDTSGIAWGRCQQHDRGDGALIMIPPEIPARSLISPLAAQLRNQLRSHNRIVTEPARMQLRAAVHIGPVYCDDHGCAGEDVNFLCRMLDSQPLRRALASPGTDLALIVSDLFYETVIRRHPSLTDPAVFQRVKAVVKGTRVHGWLHAPVDMPLAAPGWHSYREVNCCGKHGRRVCRGATVCHGRHMRHFG
jgi:class 3 adenylate cyclase